MTNYSDAQQRAEAFNQEIAKRNLEAAASDLAAALQHALELIDALMPGVRYIALQDYKMLIDVPLEAKDALRKAGAIL